MGNGINKGGVIPAVPAPPPPLPEIKSAPSKNTVKITDVKSEGFLITGQIDANLGARKLTERSISHTSEDVGSITSSGLGESVSSSLSDLTSISQDSFEFARNDLEQVKDKLKPSQYRYVLDVLNKFERMNNNFENLEKALNSKSMNLLDKERAFIDYTGMLPHIDNGDTPPEQALVLAHSVLESFFYLLETNDIDKQSLFNEFFDQKETCFEGICSAAQNYQMSLNQSTNIVAEYGHDLDIDKILSNEVLAYQKINNLDPMIDMVSASEFKTYLMRKGEDCLGYQAKDGVLTEAAIDAFTAEQVEMYCMDP